jgi:hypothetical protein
MSLWLKRKDKEGRTHIYAVPIAPTVIFAMIGILIALLIPVLQFIRRALGG